MLNEYRSKAGFKKVVLQLKIEIETPKSIKISI